MNGAWIPSHIQVTVVQAKDLALKSKSVNSEIFVVVQVDKEKECTSSVPRDTSPHWNQTFEIPLMSLDSSLELSVRQKAKILEEHIGYVQVPFSHLIISRRLKQNWYKLGPRPGKVSVKVRGDLLISISFLEKWDSTPDKSYTNPIDLEINGRNEMSLLRRSKTEYQSNKKNSPKHDKPKGLFRRSVRKKTSQVYEDCEDDFESFSMIHSPNRPPTPPGDELRKRQLSTRHIKQDSRSSIQTTSSADSDSYHSPQLAQLMFSEAAQLEKSGVVDLLRTDPVTWREQEKDIHAGKLEREEEGGTNEDVIRRSPPFRRHKRPLSVTSPSRESQSLGELNKTSPSTSPAVTYRAKSSIRRQRKERDDPMNTHSTNSLHSNHVDSESSIMSECHSESSTVINTTTAAEEHGSVSDSSKPERSAEVLSQPETSSTRARPDSHSPKQVSRSPSLSNNRRKVQKPTVARGYSTLAPRFKPQDKALKEGAAVLKPSTVSSDKSSGDTKRHSADVAQLILSQGSNDGLENILNKGQLREMFQRNVASDSERRKSNLFLAEITSTKVGGSSSSSTPAQKVDHQERSPMSDTPATINVRDDLHQPRPKCDSSSVPNSTSTSAVPSTTSDTPSLDSSYDDPDQTDFGEPNGHSATPSQLTLCDDATLDVGTLSPEPIPLKEEETPQRESSSFSKDAPNEDNPPRKPSKKHTVAYKLSGGQNSKKDFEPFQPLPPSLSQGSVPVRGRYSSTTDIQEMLSTYRESSPHYAGQLDLPANIRSTSQCTSVYSTNSSARTSPVFEDEEERDQENINAELSSDRTRLPPISPLATEITSPTGKLSLPVVTYDTQSLPRRRKGGGLMKTLSFYQENRRQTTAVTTRTKKPVERGRSLDVGNDTDTSSGQPLFAKLSSRWRQRSSTSKDGPPDPRDTSGYRTDSPLIPQHIEDSPTMLRNDADSLRHDDNSPIPRHDMESPLMPQYDSELSRPVPSSDGKSETKTDTPISNGHYPQAPPTTESTERIPKSSSPKKKLIEPSVSINDELTEDMLQKWSQEALIKELLLTRAKLRDVQSDHDNLTSYLDKLLLKVIEHTPELLSITS